MSPGRAVVRLPDTGSDCVDEPKRRGRKRAADVDASVLHAALAELASVGIGGFAIERVAASAGVARTTVYRRWPTRDALIVDALATLYDPVGDLPGTGLRDDLVHLAQAVQRKGAAGARQVVADDLLPRLLVEGRRFPECVALFRDRVVGPRRAVLVARVEQAVQDGELPDETDAELVADLVSGPILWRFMTQHVFGAAPADHPERIVDAVLNGIWATRPDG